MIGRRIGLALACLAAMSVAACGTLGTITSAMTGGPAVIADQTKLDEQVGLSLTLAYTAAAKAAGLAIQVAAAAGHPFSSATVQKIGQLDTRAYNAVTAVRAAYVAGNGTNYLSAISDARAAINDILAAIGGRPVSLQQPPGGYVGATLEARSAHVGLVHATGRRA